MRLIARRRGDDHRLDRLAFPEEPLAFRACLLKGVDLVGRWKGTRPHLEAAEIGHASRIREETLIGSQLIVFDLVELGAGGELLALLHGVLGLFDQTRDEVCEPRAVDDRHALGQEAHGHGGTEEKPEKEGGAAHALAQIAQGVSGAFIVETMTVVPSLCSRAVKYFPSARNWPWQGETAPVSTPAQAERRVSPRREEGIKRLRRVTSCPSRNRGHRASRRERGLRRIDRRRARRAQDRG